MIEIKRELKRLSLIHISIENRENLEIFYRNLLGLKMLDFF